MSYILYSFISSWICRLFLPFGFYKYYCHEHFMHKFLGEPKFSILLAIHLVELLDLWCVLGRFSDVRLFVTLWPVAHQAPLSMGFSRQEYWSGLPCPPPGDLPNSGIKPSSPVSLVLQADS